MVLMRKHATLAAAALVAVLCLGEHISLRAQVQGITVHGRWTIDVRNPDGTLASHHEFDNALVTPAGGNVFLAGLLGRFYRQFTNWSIVLQGGGANPTRVVLPEHVGSGPPAVGELTLNVPTRPDGRVPTGTLELNGTAQLSEAVQLIWVETRLDTCRGDACLDPVNFGFTAHNLSTPISLTAGQLLQIRVVFSFS
jgi:hypothetical protein